MNRLILNGDYSLLPQPPEAIAQQLPAKKVGYIALEHILAANSTVFRAMLFGAITTEDQPVSELRSSIIRRWHIMRVIPSPERVNELFASASKSGVIKYKPSAKTVSIEQEGQLLPDFSNHLLAVSYDSGIPLMNLYGKKSSSVEWSALTDLQHLRRLLVIMKIAHGRHGISVPAVVASRNVNGAPANDRAVRGLVSELETKGYLTTDASKPFNIFPGSEIITARKLILQKLKHFFSNPDDFAESATAERDRVKPAFASMYEKETR